MRVLGEWRHTSNLYTKQTSSGSLHSFCCTRPSCTDSTTTTTDLTIHLLYTYLTLQLPHSPPLTYTLNTDICVRLVPPTPLPRSRKDPSLYIKQQRNDSLRRGDWAAFWACLPLYYYFPYCLQQIWQICEKCKFAFSVYWGGFYSSWNNWLMWLCLLTIVRFVTVVVTKTGQ